MASTTDNYCQLLGLDPYNENKYSADKIEEKIKKMEVKWANEFRNKQNDTGQRFKYHRLLEEVPEIRRRMNDPLEKKKVFAEGKKALEGKCQRLKLDCVILTDGKHIILPGIIDNFMKRLHWDGVDKKQVLRLANISDGTVPKPVSEKVVNAYVNITTVNSYTPVEVLNTLIKMPDLEIKCDPLTDTSSMAQIRNAFNLCEKRVNSVRQELLPDQDSYISVLRSIKLIIDSDSEMKDLVNYGKCNKALEPVMDTIEREYTGQQITRKYIDDLLNVYVRGRDLDMCVAILEGFCHKKRIAANFSNMDSTMIRCPSCNNMVPGGKNTIFCPFCGNNFKTVCPKCKTPQPSSNKNCINCGFNFKEGEAKAQSLALGFKMDMQRGNLTKAESDLNQLKLTFATYAGIALMEAQLQKEQGSMNTLKKMIVDYSSRGKYYSAKNAGDALMKQFPSELQNHPDVMMKYDESVRRFNTADQYCKEAASLGLTNRSLMLKKYVEAAEECPDHPAAKSVLKQYPPARPLNPSSKLDNGAFTIRFLPPADNANVSYVIYREKNGMPTITDETRPLAETWKNEYTDKTMEPGVEYNYALFSKRWGILSRESVIFENVILLADVENVSIEPIDGGLRIIYEKPRGASKVRLYRNDDLGSGMMEIALNGETVYDDIGLKGGLRYHYLFVTEYQNRDRIERSRGCKYAAVPLEMPPPVNNMGIKHLEDGTFQARWSSKSPVTLFYSPNRYTFQTILVKMDAIRSMMKEVSVIQSYNDGVRFTLPEGKHYIYPIIPMGKNGVRGNEAIVYNVKPFRDVQMTMNNTDCIISMEWPKDAVSAKLVISSDGPKDYKDPTAEIVTVSREEYEADGIIKIPIGKSQVKHINIFAAYTADGDTLYSKGIVVTAYSVECRKVRYQLDAGKKSATLTIDAGTDLMLPEVVIMHVVEGFPLKKGDGEMLWSSKGPVHVPGGRCKLDIDLKGHTDVEHMRLFFSNEEEYYRIKIIHPLYGRHG